MAKTVDERIAGLEAALAQDWARADELLREADAQGLLEPADLEVLAESAIWNGRMGDHVGFLERAFAGYTDGGQHAQAAIVATRLAHDYQTMLQPAVAQGWMGRAKRLLEDLPEGVAHGYWALEQSLRELNGGDPEAALALAHRAEELGRAHGDRNLEVRGLQRRGSTLVARGDVMEGRALLDEASAAAVAGELSPYSTINVYCNTIGACRDVADFERAGEWTELAQSFCTTNSMTAFPGLCRVNHAEVMRFKGRLGEAEDEAGRACVELRAWAPRIAGAAFYELGEIRLRLGDLDAAEEAFREADDLGRSTEPGLSLLRLARGNVKGAWSSMRRALADDSASVPMRARLLGPAVEIAIAAGDLDEAERHAGELAEIAASFETSALLAESQFARGHVALERGDSAGAFALLRAARRLWDATGATYDVARVRELLGRAAREDGDEETAAWELQAAAARFERLGALRDAERVADLLRPAADRTVTKTFLFTDIVKSTELLETIEDRHWANVLRRHDDTLRAIFSDYGGQVVDHTGDGFFVAFDAADAAVQAAITVQGAIDQEFVFDIRVGLHTDGALQAGENYRGRGVHTAARVGAAATGREILATAASIAGLPGIEAADPRVLDLKGLKEPVEVASIAWR